MFTFTGFPKSVMIRKNGGEMNKLEGSNILVVDDKPDNLRLLSGILREEGYVVRAALDGKAALSSANYTHPDLIFLDIMMPGMDGYDVCKVLKSEESTRDIPVIFISALNEVFDKVKAFSAGGVDYITKPFQEEEVLARVKTHLHIRQLQHWLEKKNTTLSKQTAVLKAKNRRLRELKEAADKARQEVMDSINYAKMIQKSILPNIEQVKTFLPESFFLWMPRDIVGGDMFFADTCGEGFVIAMIDCTGHGVPGAFMTMIASSGLRTIVKDEECHNPSEILKRLNFFVKTTLQQDQSYAVSDDGLDAAICFLEPRDERQEKRGRSAARDSLCLTFAGANLPLFYVRNGEAEIIRGDKQSIGYKRSDLNFKFANHTIPVREGTSFYMATDGYQDQMSRDENSRFGCKRLGRRRFAGLIGKISALPFEDQEERLIEAFHEHKGDMPRQDDVTVVGFGF